MPLSNTPLPSPFPSISPSSHQIPTASFSNLNASKLLFSSFAPLALALALNSPLPSLAVPPPISQTSPSLPTVTPFSQSKNFQTGIENGKIRPCPSINPGCVSTNPKSSSFAFPLVIPEGSSERAVERLRDAILKTQKNPKIQVVEETPDAIIYKLQLIAVECMTTLSAARTLGGGAVLRFAPSRRRISSKGIGLHTTSQRLIP